MNLQTAIILIIIGLAAGSLGGFVGIGGGVIIVPALIYIMGFSTHQAMGTSLAVMLPPVGILAVVNYYRAGDLNLPFALVIAAAFILGGYAGSKISISLKGSEHIIKLVFGILMLYISGRMIYEAMKTFFK